ncbi:MAG: hypothetical protein AAF371_01135 [Pseudomonadota bacterium]
MALRQADRHIGAGRTLAASRACAAALALMLAACQTPPPPPGVVVPQASEDVARPGDAGDSVEAGLEGTVAPAEGAPPRPPRGARLIGLEIAVENPPEELLDPAGAGVLVLKRRGDEGTRLLAFLDGALSVHALPPGAYAVRGVAGFDCGPLAIAVPPGEAPVYFGRLTLSVGPEGERAVLRGAGVAEPADLVRFAALFGGEEARVDPRPLLQDAEIACRRAPWLVARPDIDPSVRVLTPFEIAQLVILGGAFGAVTGAAAAVGSVVFISGTAGSLLFLGF